MGAPAHSAHAPSYLPHSTRPTLHKRHLDRKVEGQVGIRNENLVAVLHQIRHPLGQIRLGLLVHLRRAPHEQRRASRVHEPRALDLPAPLVMLAEHNAQLVLHREPLHELVERPVALDLDLHALAATHGAVVALLVLPRKRVERVVAGVLMSAVSLERRTSM